jgi:hypothetical protein
MTSKTSRMPKTSTQLKQPSSNLIKTTIYNPKTGAFHMPSPANYFGEEGVGLARCSWGDSRLWGWKERFWEERWSADASGGRRV